MLNVFMSYIPDDSRKAKIIGDMLHACPVDIIIRSFDNTSSDRRTLSAIKVVPQMITEADTVFILLSRKSISSKMIEQDTLFAYNLGCRIVPIFLGDYSIRGPLSLILSNSEHCLYFLDRNFENDLKNLF